MSHQINFTFKESDWKTPSHFPNLKDVKFKVEDDQLDLFNIECEGMCGV